MEWTEIFRSVELVWLTLILALVGAILSARHIRRSWQPLRWKDVLRDEQGGPYMIAYVLTFPILVLTVCAIVQSSLILITKTGTMYAAFAAARSAVVCVPAEPSGEARQQVRRAAVNAMAPFATHNSDHLLRLGGPSGSIGDAALYVAAYKLYSQNGNAPASYLMKKYVNASAGMRSVSWTPDRPQPEDTLELTLNYDMPLYIPWFARLLGHPGGIFPIETRIKMNSEAAIGRERQPSGRPMGIDYRSF